MKIDFSILRLGNTYERPFLAKIWGYQSFHALSKGVITPTKSRHIILFVTKEKQGTFPQYKDFLDGDMLFWEGEEKHGSDKRITDAKKNGDQIHLFYREIHHTPFVYLGEISLLDFHIKEGAPSEFLFRVDSLTVTAEDNIFREVNEHVAEYRILDKTEQEQIIVSRLGQGDFRRGVIRIWGSCSLTGLQNLNLLRASHIKPWKDSTNSERLNPYNGLLLTPDYDFLFDHGYISFTDRGKILISDRLDPMARQIFSIDPHLSLRRSFPESVEYLHYHRDAIYK